MLQPQRRYRVRHKAVEFPVTEGLCKSKVTRTPSMTAAYHLMKIKKSN